MLSVEGLSIRFGGLNALADLNLEVGEWEIVGLIGPNGAGKTTAFNCITGVYRPSAGQVIFKGRDITALPTHRRAALGMGRTFQNVGMVKTASAVENLRTAQHMKAGYPALSGILGTGRVMSEERAITARADALLDLLDLRDARDTVVSSLPYGVQKLLELGCALASEPDLLLLDEPSSGMGPEEAHQLGRRLATVRAQFGLTMLLIEHHVPLVTSLCDHVYVLNFGQLLAEGPPDFVRAHPDVVTAYLGEEVEPTESSSQPKAKPRRRSGGTKAAES
jgi:branched-chain amino acid transport system ATP-binding protein